MKSVAQYCRGLIIVCFMLLCPLIFTSCAPRLTEPFKELPAIPSGKAVIYIYRPSQATHPTIVAGNARVVYEDKTLAWFPYGGYYPLLVNPGEVELSTVTDAVTLDVKAGASYFLRIGSRHLGSTVKWTIAPIAPVEAYEDLAQCQLMDIKSKDGSQL